ncbi:MAG: ion channel [Rhodospirillaceae bacterium]
MDQSPRHTLPPPREEIRHHPARAVPAQRGWIGAVSFTAFLLSVIALSIKAVAGTLAFVLLGSVIFVVAVFHRVFPGSHFFTLSLVNFIGIYACIFTVIVESNFAGVSPREQALGFILPLLAFLGGAAIRSRSVRNIVISRRPRHDSHFGEIFLWLLPMVGMIALTFALPGGFGGQFAPVPFVAFQAVLAVIVLFVSRDIAIFLLDVGLLFEGFFQQASRLVMPAFAFLTFYSLLVIIFAALYSIAQRLFTGINFIASGTPHTLNFAECLYFSVVTLSTVGYGDIQPISGPIRFISAMEIVMGVLLLLFGFSAIIRHSPSANRSPPDDF